MHAFYLHGFASSGQSKKGVFFAERLRAHGVDLHCPDFNEPDFSSLTMTRMLAQLAADIAATAPGPVALIGSSLGAVVAIHTAARMPGRVNRLILLAPAVTFPRDAGKVIGADRFSRWSATGTLEVFHFAAGEMLELKYGFYEDGLQYDVADVHADQPTLIFQGRRDESVDYRDVERYAAARPRAALTLLDDDHHLMSSLPRIWSDMVDFLELA